MNTNNYYARCGGKSGCSYEIPEYDSEQFYIYMTIQPIDLNEEMLEIEIISNTNNSNSIKELC